MNSNNERRPKNPGLPAVFFIVFVAMVAAFFVNNLLQRYLPSKKEDTAKKAKISFLNAAISKTDNNIRLRNEICSQIDSLVLLITEKKIFGYENRLYYFGRNIISDLGSQGYQFDLLQANNNPWITLKSVAPEKIISYENARQDFIYMQQKESAAVNALHPFLVQIFNPVEFEKMVDAKGNILAPTNNPYLRSTEPELLTDLVYYIHLYKSAVRAATSALRTLQVRAKKLAEDFESDN